MRDAEVLLAASRQAGRQTMSRIHGGLPVIAKHSAAPPAVDPACAVPAAASNAYMPNTDVSSTAPSADAGTTALAGTSVERNHGTRQLHLLMIRRVSRLW